MRRFRVCFVPRLLLRRSITEWQWRDSELQLPPGKEWVSKVNSKREVDSLVPYSGRSRTKPSPTLAEDNATELSDEKIPIDLFHDLKGTPTQKNTLYPFSNHDPTIPLRNQRFSKTDQEEEKMHRERIVRIADLLSNLSTTSNADEIIRDIHFGKHDFQRLLHELEFRGQRHTAINLLKARQSQTKSELTQQFCDSFMKLLVHKDCPLEEFLQFREAFEEHGLTIPTELITRLAYKSSKKGNIDLAIHLHKALNSARSETAIFNSFIDSYVAEKQYNKAIEIYEEMKKRSVKPDIYTFASLVSSCHRSYDDRKMFLLFDEMKAEGLQPDLYIYNQLIRSCERVNDLSAALSIYDSMKTVDQVVPNAKTFYVLINLCGRHGRLSLALKLLEELKESGELLTTRIINSLIQCCVRSGNSSKAFTFYELLRQEKTKPDGYTFGCLLRACSSSGDVSRALQLLDDMKAIGVPRDVVIYTSAIDVCAVCGDVETAMMLLQRMSYERIAVNNVTGHAIIRTCIQAATNEMSFSLLDEAKRLGVKISQSAYLAMMKTCSLSGDLTKCTKWRSRMAEDGIDPDVTMFTILISAAANAKDVQSAQESFQEMLDRDIKATIEPYNAYLYACNRARDYEEGMRVLNTLQSGGDESGQDMPTPDVETFNIIIDLCIKERRSGQARALVREMKSRGLQPDDRTYAVLNFSN